MKTHSVALIGCGKIGAEERGSEAIRPGTHLGAYLGDSRLKIVALIDPSEANLAAASARAPGVPTFRSLAEMPDSIGPDVISIAAPSPLHAELVLAAAQRPIKAIVCEKPLAMRVEDGVRMIDACRAKGILLLVNHMRRFDHGLREVRRRLEEFGPIVQAQAVYVRGIYNNGTHLIDLLRFLLGDVAEVSALPNAMTTTFKDLAGDHNVDGLLTFAGDVRASVQSLDSDDYSAMNIVLYGRKGRVTVSHFGFRATFEGLVPCDAYPGHMEIDEWRPASVGEPRSFFAPMAEHLVACLDGREQPLSTGEDALAALKVIDALVESARAGGTPVRLRP